ncbi:hypothetical protein [Alishewanella sp. SMS8]|uniref:hypothetical protein n=1 Tax=Alishewanella sp. SMS8 TaxID=2994676 RepID=UPI0027427003|nr:hypothetical protein [Alishewanella sp. SMS8]MDP5206345.1 hypothetical protein [Alishewanella sp. SMS9]MDP5459903.1 hypothetical protein [Alishewanella sp. SMS8]
MSIANIGLDEQDLVIAKLKQLEALAFTMAVHKTFTEICPKYSSEVFSLFWDLLVEIIQALGINKD